MPPIRLAPRFHDRVAAYVNGTATVPADYLQEGLNSGRFVWPPPESEWRQGAAQNVTQDCSRCRKLYLTECLCSDIHGRWQTLRPALPDGAGVDGDASMEDTRRDVDDAGWKGGLEILEYDGDEEGAGMDGDTTSSDSGLAGLEVVPAAVRRPVDVQWEWDDDKGALTVTNNPLAAAKVGICECCFSALCPCRAITALLAFDRLASSQYVSGGI